jgi:hypothetical protein
MYVVLASSSRVGRYSWYPMFSSLSVTDLTVSPVNTKIPTLKPGTFKVAPKPKMAIFSKTVLTILTTFQQLTEGLYLNKLYVWYNDMCISGLSVECQFFGNRLYRSNRFLCCSIYRIRFQDNVGTVSRIWKSICSVFVPIFYFPLAVYSESV